MADHVQALQSTLGPAAIPQPAINLSALSTVMSAALGQHLSYPFDPTLDDYAALLGAFVFEVGAC